MKIKWGKNATYKEITNKVFEKKNFYGPRAVGNACLYNPIIILIPCHRIIKSDGLVEIVTPHYSDTSSWQDPSHQWHLNSRSFEHFETTSETNYYSNARFKIEFSEIKLLKLYKLLGFEFLVNLQNFSSHYRFFRKFWEQYLCTVVRGKVMTFKLRAIK